MTQRVFVFLCNSETKREVFELDLVGTTMGFGHQAFGDLEIGDLILICDYQGGHVSGPFRITEVGMPLNRGAWPGRGFVFQARFEECGTRMDRSVDEVCTVLPSFWSSGSKQPRPSFFGDEALTLLEHFGWTGEECPATKPLGFTGVTIPQSVQVSFYKTEQGFFVKSKAERSIANWFEKVGIRCHYEKAVPGHSGYLCDFYLPDHDVYVEYWGLLSDAVYAERANEKRKMYRAAGAKLIEIVPEDERDLDAALRRKLIGCGISLTGLMPAPAGVQVGILVRLMRFLRGLFFMTGKKRPARDRRDHLFDTSEAGTRG